ncbi:unnamed protein product [Toxocara canis]|uniref:Nucleoporin Nup54 alpha-helical domain-containing protein n=1 Tax=Toxocara canis TaxID=6265 RepID=A0A183V2S4_TOXCA|nr:unnamed protein product [Toxocara canis]
MAWLAFVLLQYSLHLSIAQMGFGGGGYCAKCAMANSGINSHAFGFGGMSSNPSFGSSFGTAQVNENNFGAAATLNSLGFGTNSANIVNVGSASGINPAVDPPSSTPPTDNSNVYSLVTSNPCMNSGCFVFPAGMASPCCGGNGGCCGGQFRGFNPGFGGSTIIISPNALSNTDSTASNIISPQLSSLGNNNPFEAGAFSSMPNTASLFNGQLVSNPFGTTLNSFTPFGSSNPSLLDLLDVPQLPEVPEPQNSAKESIDERRLRKITERINQMLRNAETFADLKEKLWKLRHCKNVSELPKLPEIPLPVDSGEVSDGTRERIEVYNEVAKLYNRATSIFGKIKVLQYFLRRGR